MPFMECREMTEKKPTPRYNIWLHTRQDDADEHKAHGFIENKTQSISGSTSHITKLDDLQTSMLLYGYGLPIETAIDGVCKIGNGQSAQCTTKSISSESVDLIYKKSSLGTSKPIYNKSHVGSTIALDLEEIGTFEGVITSQNKDGFQVAVDSSCQSQLGTRLADMADRRGIKHNVSIAAGPGVTRVEPTNKNCSFKDPAGILRKGIMVNLSQTDVLIRTTNIPSTPSIISFKGPRTYAAEVTSTFAIGFVAKFCNPIPASEFSKDIQFVDF